ncbi:MAG: NYN domain-containing protein, partial [Bacteroidales bacterium]|nr:NYN domain-containing protein [Bacteroidales bacterium]
VFENQSLYTYLQKIGYICVFKPTLEISKNKKVKIKGNVDAELVLHTMIEWENYDKAMIVSGDGDFHCLIEHLEKKQKLLRIITPNKKYSSLLRKCAKYILNIGLMKNKLEKRS